MVSWINNLHKLIYHVHKVRKEGAVFGATLIVLATLILMAKSEFCAMDHCDAIYSVQRDPTPH